MTPLVSYVTQNTSTNRHQFSNIRGRITYEIIIVMYVANISLAVGIEPKINSLFVNILKSRIFLEHRNKKLHKILKIFSNKNKILHTQNTKCLNICVRKGII